MDLRTTIAAGVAFHHAGLDPADRHTIETGFLQGQINIICCTSTLAVGVNLPCHMVIIKNTVGWQDGGCKEYSDLELMQMLGRAGRPQFDDSAIAIILTRKERVNHYERLVSGSESLESCLHLHLIDHLNAEIGLGNVTDVESAVRWLAGTFLFVRLRRNPTHYKLKEGANRDDEDEMIRQICEKDIKLLQDCDLVSSENLKSTQFGDAMARYYVRFETMKTLLTLKPQASMCQILDVVAQAEEFRDIRLKSGEKSLYKEVNRAHGIRFPMKVDIAIPAHKILLLIQSELGAVDFPDGEQFQKHKFAFQQDKTFVFSHINRLIRCVIDCQIFLADSIAVRNALELARCFGARVWDDSPLQMKQIEQIGIVAVRKIAGAGITSIEELEATEAHQVDMVLSKNPPFGVKLLARLGDFPKLRVSVKMTGKDLRPGQPVKVRFKAEIAFMNDKVPTFFQRRPVYVCFMAETSDGHMIDFRRLSASKVKNGHEILLCTELKNAGQYIACYAMCDDIAGTMRFAELKPQLPVLSFLPRSREKTEKTLESTERTTMNTSRPRSIDISRDKAWANYQTDIFDGDDLEFDELLAPDQRTDWASGDNEASYPTQEISHAAAMKESNIQEGSGEQASEAEEPTRLENGRWACNHKCKDKTTCKHFCCRDGLEKPPKPSWKRSCTGNKASSTNQLTLSASITKKDAADAPDKHKESIGSALTQPVLRRNENSDSKTAGQHRTGRSILSEIRPMAQEATSSEYGDDSLDDLPSPSALLRESGTSAMGFPSTNDKKEPERGTEENIFDDLWDIVETPSAETPAQHERVENATKPMELLQENTRPNSPWSSNCVPGIDSTPISSLFPGDAGSILASTADFDDSRGQKRKDCPAEEDTDNDGKRLKPCTPDPPLEEQTTTLPALATSKQDLAGVQAGTPSGKQGWGDIDPVLLDEFKDIVNFF
ncbi:hypothetical protein PHISP_06488 [Aspergillus sp. HF37]|nr:hypothetical protein PHISP_06488 [Aspergillus sp. HF37]